MRYLTHDCTRNHKKESEGEDDEIHVMAAVDSNHMDDYGKCYNISCIQTGQTVNKYWILLDNHFVVYVFYKQWILDVKISYTK